MNEHPNAAADHGRRGVRDYVPGYAPALIRQDVKTGIHELIVQRGLAREQNVERCVISGLLELALSSPEFLAKFNTELLKDAVVKDFDLLAGKAAKGHHRVPAGTNR